MCRYLSQQQVSAESNSESSRKSVPIPGFISVHAVEHHKNAAQEIGRSSKEEGDVARVP